MSWHTHKLTLLSLPFSFNVFFNFILCLINLALYIVMSLVNVSYLLEILHFLIIFISMIVSRPSIISRYNMHTWTRPMRIQFHRFNLFLNEDFILDVFTQAIQSLPLFLHYIYLGWLNIIIGATTIYESVEFVVWNFGRWATHSASVISRQLL